MKIACKGGRRLVTEACGLGHHDACKGTAERDVAGDDWRTPCECVCHAPDARGRVVTLFETTTEACEHGRLPLERCPHCELAAEARAAQNEAQAPYVAGSRTSFEASRVIKPTVGNLREKAYAVIRDHGPISDERIAILAKMNPSTVRPRRIELERAGRVRKSGYTLTQAGRKAVAWVVTTSSDQGF